MDLFKIIYDLTVTHNTHKLQKNHLKSQNGMPRTIHHLKLCNTDRILEFGLYMALSNLNQLQLNENNSQTFSISCFNIKHAY
jgi:hypothetical protein